MTEAPHIVDTTDDTTIVAVATPPGRGGIGVLRLSGSAAARIAQTLIAGKALQPRVAQYAVLRDAEAKRIDDAVVTWFAAPHSYTGEDVVEIATHGSPVVLDWLLRSAVTLGAVPARAGEFTERAFLHGRLDLTAAEAVRDLIDAQTLAAAQQAAQQMGGAIAATVRPVKQQLVELIATLEAGIDFAEDDIDLLPQETILQRVLGLLPPLILLHRSFAQGRLLRQGMQLAIVGKPNVGKSSLFNRLVQSERAIVTAVPGTTRDVLRERFELEGIPVELLDTAGLRDTDDEVERIGVARSRTALADADAVLLVIDASDAAEHDVPFAWAGRRLLVILNKRDTASAAALQKAVAHCTQAYGSVPVLTSATTGEGMHELRTALLTMVRGSEETAHGATLTTLRQRDEVERAIQALHRAESATRNGTPHEMLLLDAYEALSALDALTGTTSSDDILNLIFSTFCIGK